MATWYIKDGDIPYLEEFPEMSEFNGYPDGLWRIVDGDIPFRNFPEMCDIDDAPDSLWRIIDGDIPFRNFPEMCGIDDAPAFFWIIQEDSEYNKDTPYKKDIPYRSSFPAMYKPRKERPPKYKKFPIEIDEYSCTIPIQVDYVQTVILDTYNVTVITEG